MSEALSNTSCGGEDYPNLSEVAAVKYLLRRRLVAHEVNCVSELRPEAFGTLLRDLGREQFALTAEDIFAIVLTDDDTDGLAGVREPRVQPPSPGGAAVLLALQDVEVSS